MTSHIAWIRTFEAAARCGSLTLAGVELGLTQAAVSQQIKALESRLRVQLLQREPRGVSVTGAGAELYNEVVEGLSQIDRALSKYLVHDSQELFLLCNTSLANRWLIPRLPDFCRRHPDIMLRMSTVLRRTDAFGLRCDIELFLRQGPAGAGLVRFGDGAMLAVAAPNQGSTLRADLESKRVRIATVINYDAMYANWMTSLRQGKGIVPALVEVDSFHAALSLVESGAAVTVCPRMLALDSLSQGTLVEMSPAPEAPTASYWQVVRNQQSSSAKAFCKWLEEISESSVPVHPALKPKSKKWPHKA